MPIIRKLDSDLWEVRSFLGNKIARVLFTILNSQMILVHGFIKKSQKTPKEDIKLALKRISDIRR